jgi:hypothetical protein
MTISASSPSDATSDRLALIRQAFQLEYLTLAWMTIEATVAIGSGIAADSLTLTAFAATRRRSHPKFSSICQSPLP